MLRALGLGRVFGPSGVSSSVVVVFVVGWLMLRRSKPGRQMLTPPPQLPRHWLLPSRWLPLPRREVGAGEVLDRCLLPLVNEGFKIVQVRN